MQLSENVIFINWPIAVQISLEAVFPGDVQLHIR